MPTNKVAVLWYFNWKHKTDFCGETLINHPKKWNKEDFCVLASLLPFHLGIIKANRNEFVHVLRLRNCFSLYVLWGALDLAAFSGLLCFGWYFLFANLYTLILFLIFARVCTSCPMPFVAGFCVNNTKPHTSPTVAPFHYSIPVLCCATQSKTIVART